MALTLINKNFVLEDDGNKLICKNGLLTLKLKGSTRKIGGLYESDKNSKTYYVKSSLKEHLHVFRKNDSWGLMNCVLEQLPEDSIIVLHSDKARYRISLSDAKKKGSFLYFKTKGFEKQFFVPRKFWGVG